MTGLCRVLILSLLVWVFTPGRSVADGAWQQSNKVWKAMDQCARAAQRAFPDYTHEARIKREAFRSNCLRRENLPGDEDARLEQPAQPR